MSSLAHSSSARTSWRTDRDRLGALACEVATAHVADLVLAVAVPAARGDCADPGVSSVGVDGQHQSLGEDLDREDAASGDGADLVQTAGAPRCGWV